LTEVVLEDVYRARTMILEESGDIIADRVLDISKGAVVSESVVRTDSVWTGVRDEGSFLKAMKEEKYGTRPFANTLNWLRTKVPFIRALQTKLPWVK
jgi:hypothetical protein